MPSVGVSFRPHSLIPVSGIRATDEIISDHLLSVI